MLPKSFKPAKCKTSLKLASSRIKLLKNKKEAQIKQLRREVAQMLDSGQVQTARIRVEHVIREEKTMGAYDLIEIYCELIAARLPNIESQKNCPIDLKEAIASVVFSSPRCADIPELRDVRKHFQAKYGKDFISSSVELRPDCGVNRSLVGKLSAKTPDVSTKLKILTAIAGEHNIKWDPNSFGGNDTSSQDDLLKGPSTFEKASRMHEEHTNVHVPYNTQASPSVDVGSHKGANAEPLKNLTARASLGRQNIPPSSERFGTPTNYDLEMKFSGNVVEGSEARHRYSGDANINYMSRPDWNMEFTDATAAAQAAAESAERASMAARAAAELSSRGRVTPHYVPDSLAFRDERLERPSVLRPPGESPSKSQANNASFGRKSGSAYNHVDKSEENLAHDHKSYDAPRKSASYKSIPDGGSIFHGGPVSGYNIVDRRVSDAYSSESDDCEDDNSLSGMTKKLHRDVYKKSSNSNEPNVGDAVGDVDTLVHEQHAAGNYTEMNPWSAGLENDDGISDRRSERKNSFGEVNSTRLSEKHARKDSCESFVEFTPDVKESYGYKRDSSRASTRSQPSRSSYFAEKQGFSSLSNEMAEDGLAENPFADYDEERISMRNKAHARKDSGESFVEFTPDVKESYGYKRDSSCASTRSQPSPSSSFAEKQGFSSLSNEMAEDGLAENPFVDYDEERISMRNKAAGESAVVFDDYESDDDVDIFDLDRGPKSSFAISSPPLVEAEQSENSGTPVPERIADDFLGTSASAAHYSPEKHSSMFAETVPGKAASETEENLPVTFDDSDGPSSENEEEPEKSNEPGRIDDSGYQKSYGSSKFTPVSEAEIVYSSSTRQKIHEGESEQEVASDSGSGLAFGNLTGGFQNKSPVALPYMRTMTNKDSSNQSRNDPSFSPSNSTWTDKASDEDPDIHYVDDQLKSRPNRRTQTNFAVSHEVTIPQPKMGSCPVAYDDDEEEEEEEEEEELEADYWRKPSTRPVKNDYAEKTRLSSRSSLVSDSDGNNDIVEGHPSQVSSGKSRVGAMGGLSRRTKAGTSSTDCSTYRKPATDSGESGGRKDTKNLGFSPRTSVAGGISVKPRARTNTPDHSESSGNLKWRSKAKDKPVSDTAKPSPGGTPKKTTNNQSPVPSGKEDATESLTPGRPSLDSTSREDSFNRAGHVHPKMPDYETFLANLHSLRTNRQ